MKDIFLTSSNNSAPLVIAHRGYSQIAPENSFAAFKKAIEINVDMIEFDVRLSSDDAFVVIHDKNLLRTANINSNVNKLNSDIIKQLNCGNWFGKNFANEKIPLLSEVLKIASKKTFLNIEIKPDAKSDAGLISELFINSIKNFKNKNYIFITSFNHKIISEIKKLDQTLKTGVLFNSLTDFRFSPSKLCARSNADVFICNKLQVNKDVVIDAHKSEIPIFVYGVYTETDVKRLINLNVDGLIADDPRMVKSAIAKFHK